MNSEHTSHWRAEKLFEALAAVAKNFVYDMPHKRNKTNVTVRHFVGDNHKY